MPASDAYFSDANITDLINGALEYVSSLHDFYWLENVESLATAASTQTISTGASSQRTIALYDASGIELEWKPLSELVRIPADATSAYVRFFGYRGSTLILRPVPVGVQTLTHVYRGVEPRLTSGSDTPLMPSQFHDVIADRATQVSHLRQGDLNTAKAFQAVAEEGVQAMIAHSDRYADSEGGGARTESAPTAEG